MTADPARLPRPLSSFVGRGEEIRRIVHLLAGQRVRLLTLTGPGGVGKTRGALEVATLVRAAFPSGVRFVDLTALSDARAVIPTIAADLDVQESDGVTLLEQIAASMRGQRLLLILDNCEHVLGAASDLSRLLALAPDLQVLATSRVPLHLAGERTFPIQPLPAVERPDVDGELTVEAVAASPAVQLLVERARAVQPEFALTPSNAAALAALCERLSGLPLAIELAAPRLRLLSPEALLARLEQGLPLLTGGPGDAPARHRTLRAALDWSYTLLTEREQAWLRRLSIFQGGASLEAAQAVCEPHDAAPGGVLDTLNTLDALAAHNLIVRAAASQADVRVTMLPLVQEYALDRLRATDEHEQIAWSHARYFRALAEEAEPQLIGPEATAWLDRMDLERHNLAAVVRWAATQGAHGNSAAASEGLRLVGALWWYFRQRGRFAQAREWTDTLLALPAPRDATRARALISSWFGWQVAASETARQRAQEALAIAQETGERWTEGIALVVLALVSDATARPGLLDRAVAVGRDLRDPFLIGRALMHRAERQDSAAARRDLDEALDCFQRLGHHVGIGSVHLTYGQLELRTGRLGDARRHVLAALRTWREVRYRGFLSFALIALGDVAAAEGNRDEASRHFTEALRLSQQVGSTLHAQRAQEHLAALAMGQPATPPPTAPEAATEGATPATAEQPAPKRSGFPAYLTSFIGREREREEIVRLLIGAPGQRPARLLTLTGPGGSGKTRLVAEIASALSTAPIEEIVFVDLAPLGDGEHVLPAIAKALDVPEDASRAIEDRLAAAIGERALLLVPDNFEHVLEAAPAVASLVARCANLRVLATSREALRVSGEQEYPVPPLPLDKRGSVPGTVGTAGDAVRLFLDRARAVQPAFTLTPEQAHAVAGLCARLDGLPLAIELAAARVRLLSPAAMLAQIGAADQDASALAGVRPEGAALPLLSSGARDVPARHRTLRTAIAWSYGLLTLEEQRLFRALSTFRGGGTIEAAAALLSDARGALPDLPGLLDQIESLIAKSLVLRQDAGATGRFRMLETIREFGQERAEAEGEAETLRVRHAAYFTTLCETAAAGIKGDALEQGLARIDADYANVRAALAWCTAHPDGPEAVDLALRLCGALWVYWMVRGLHREGRAWAEQSTALPAANDHGAAYRWALFGSGWLANDLGDLRAAVPRFEELLALSEAAGDPHSTAYALHGLATTASSGGDYPAAIQRNERALAHLGRTDDLWLTAWAHVFLARAAARSGNTRLAREHLEPAVTLFRRMDNQHGIAGAHLTYGTAAFRDGDLTAAEQRLAIAVVMFREMNADLNLVASLNLFGHAMWIAGDRGTAAQAFEEALRRAVNRLHGSNVYRALEGVALTLAHADPARALHVFAAASALRAAAGSISGGTTTAVDWPELVQKTIGATRTQLGATAADQAWLHGQRLTLDEATRLALEHAPQAPPSPASPQAPQASLAVSGLPRSLTSFIGREAELEAVRTRLLQPDVHTLTLTGPGGSGKTRLALAAAQACAGAFRDGAVFVSLAPVAEASRVVAAIAQALGIANSADRPLLEVLQDSLRGREQLLVLDNFEHVLEAATVVAELAVVCPGVRMLVTSREALRVSGERLLPVPPLRLPDERTASDPATATDSEAVRMFVERARDAQPDFALATENAGVVAEICRRLDGLPLAIELAAARVRALPPPALLARLERRLPLLTGGRRDAPARQQTLRATVAWSYDLLTTDEQALFRRLGVFAGGCTLEAAEAVARPADDVGGTQEDAERPSDALIQTLASLVDKSLLNAVADPGSSGASGGEPRYAMLETVREYALEQLAAQDEAASSRDRHAAYFEQLAEQGERQVCGGAQPEWLDRLDAELDNLRAALDGLAAQARAGCQEALQSALHVEGALWAFAFMRGHTRESRERLEALLAIPGAEAPTRARARALHALAFHEHGAPTARAHFEEAVALAQALGDRQTEVYALTYLAGQVPGETVKRTMLDRALMVAREIGDRWSEGWCLFWLGTLALSPVIHETASGVSAERCDAAEALFRKSLATRSTCGDLHGFGCCLSSLADVSRLRGDLATARRLCQESMEIQQQIRAKPNIGDVLGRLGDIDLRAGDLASARQSFTESLAMQWERGDLGRVMNGLDRMVALETTRGEYVRALRLAGVEASFRESRGWGSSPATRELERVLAAAPEAVDPLTRELAMAEGRTMRLEDAVRYALGDTGWPGETQSKPTITS